jgi:hypothetical protein
MVKRKVLRRVKVKYGVDRELERVANIYLEGNKPAKPKKTKNRKGWQAGISSVEWDMLNKGRSGIPTGPTASKIIGRAAGVALARGKRQAASGEGVSAKKNISIGDALIGAGMVSKPGADASPYDLIEASKNRVSKKDSTMITGATRVGRKVRQTDRMIGATRKTLKTGKVVGGKRGSILGIAAMFASHLAGSNKKDRG